ncbi:hypothetical protein AMECASPLE_028734 [Ameca splendens]|uniref:Uncharacterized protein n=1 Tax=Ameca splendens TaxID=208324 RepID=A0ABV0YSN0_9TELE
MEDWKRSPVATCEAPVNSMPARVKAELENNGGHTNIYTLGTSVHGLLYIVLNCHIFNVVKSFNNVRGVIPFCEIMYIEHRGMWNCSS